MPDDIDLRAAGDHGGRAAGAGAAASPELVVLARPEARLRARGQGVDAEGDGDATRLRGVLDAHGAVLRPLFGLSEDRLRRQMEDLPPATGRGAPDAASLDLSLYYRVAAGASQLDELAEELLADDLVDAAFVKPPGEPPEVATLSEAINDMRPDAADAPPATPDFVARQGYLGVAPGGIDARWAWTLPGGRGKGLNVIDCEWTWRFTHEDLLQNQGGVVAGTSMGNADHGTAVIGVLGCDLNAVGVTGIVPDARVSASSFSDQSSAQAIKAAADKLGRGDIILLEIHRPGPNAPNPRQGQLGFIAIEW